MSTEAGELASVLAGALIRCDLMGLPFNGHHTPRPEPIRIDPREAHEAFRANPDDHRHGSLNGYSNMKCRCSRCRQANTARKPGYRAPKETPVSAVSDLFDPMPDEIKHGTLEGAKECRKGGELCFACRRVVHVAAAQSTRHSAAPRGTSKAAETAKALDAHRQARKRLQAELAAERSA